jgi:hypothetical protein
LSSQTTDTYRHPTKPAGPGPTTRSAFLRCDNQLRTPAHPLSNHHNRRKSRGTTKKLPPTSTYFGGCKTTGPKPYQIGGKGSRLRNGGLTGPRPATQHHGRQLKKLYPHPHPNTNPHPSSPTTSDQDPDKPDQRHARSAGGGDLDKPDQRHKARPARISTSSTNGSRQARSSTRARSTAGDGLADFYHG